MIGSHHLLEEPFCSQNVAFSREHKFNGVPLFVYCAIQIFAGLSDLDVRFVPSIGSAAHLQMKTNAFVDLWRISLDPPKQSCMIHCQTSLTHHFFQITVSELIPAIQTNI